MIRERVLRLTSGYENIMIFKPTIQSIQFTLIYVVNPRTGTSKVSPLPLHKRGGCWNILSWVLDMLQYFEKINFRLKQKYCDVLCRLRYMLWVAALRGACDVTQDGGHLGRTERR